MDTNLLNNYVLKAIDAYPFELEETVENLKYALSYDSNNAYALYMMGRLESEQFGDYEKAKIYFSEALANKMDFQKVYSRYILVMLANEDYDQAQTLIDFAFKVKGLGKGEVWLYQGQLYESLQKYKKALKALKLSKLLGYNNDFTGFVDSEIDRIKAKMKHNDRKSKKRKNRKKKKKKYNQF